MNAFGRRCAEAAVAACLGILGGLSVSWLRPSGSRSAPKPDPAEPAPVPEPPLLPAERGAEALALARPSEIGQRASAPASSEPPPPAPPVTSPVDVEEEMRDADRYHEAQHEAALKRHRNEPRDPRWAKITETKLEADFESVAAASKFKVVRVDCRTTTCVGILEWRSYPEAMRGYAATMRHPFAVNCAQEVLLLPPSNPAASYQASMIFDCESWRAAGN